jgi:hypothetical protein
VAHAPTHRVIVGGQMRAQERERGVEYSARADNPPFVAHDVPNATCLHGGFDTFDSAGILHRSSNGNGGCQLRAKGGAAVGRGGTSDLMKMTSLICIICVDVTSE